MNWIGKKLQSSSNVKAMIRRNNILLLSNQRQNQRYCFRKRNWQGEISGKCCKATITISTLAASTTSTSAASALNKRNIGHNNADKCSYDVSPLKCNISLCRMWSFVILLGAGEVPTHFNRVRWTQISALTFSYLGLNSLNISSSASLRSLSLWA